ncbi:MAG: mechanosensitive ion channel family protein [Deltaproteobacteria bacterium]|nr:mechanosensitive ion channel family protein [Deltaproteobacteria bacterium]
MRKIHTKKNLLLPLIIAFIFFAVAAAAKIGVFIFKADFATQPLASAAQQVFILFATLGVISILRWLIADAPLRLLHRYTVTPLLRTIVSLILYSAGAMFLLNRLLGINLVPLLTTSAVLTGIIALSLQDTIKNLFTGLWINMERIVAKGDWVKVSDKEGQVMDVTWRTTRLLTRDNDFIYLPNRILAEGVLENYTFPTPLHVLFIDVGVSHNDAPDKVKRLLAELASGTPSVLSEPSPEVWVMSFGDSAINYRLRVWVDDFLKVYNVRSELYTRIWYAFRRSGIVIPYPTRTINMRRGGKPPQDSLLKSSLQSMDFLALLKEDDLDKVAQAAKVEVFGAGEPIVRQGETGSTCYFIKSGSADVMARDPSGADNLVTTLRQGDFFGEMSLLTGEPRSATVVAREESVCIVICSEVFHSIFKEDPGMAEQLSGLLSKRSGELRQIRSRALNSETDPEKEAQVDILKKIKLFFQM